MPTFLIASKADLARTARIQTLVDEGEMAISTIVTRRPSDFPCWQGVYYAGQWYPPSDPRGAELEKLRYQLPAPKTDDTADAPRWCTTHASQVHQGRRYIRPGVIEALDNASTPILPQLLQSAEDVLEQIAMSKALVHPRKIDELAEAVQFSVEHWDNADARTLPDGYKLYASPNVAYVILTHPAIADRVVAGMKDPLSQALRFVSRRGEIREFMHKVAAGMKPSENVKLPGILMQQPIPDEARQAPTQVARESKPAEAAPAAELPLFADQELENAA